MATYLAGVDIGTSGAKAMVFDRAGNPLASAYQEYPCTYPRPGWVEQDADHLVGRPPWTPWPGPWYRAG